MTVDEATEPTTVVAETQPTAAVPEAPESDSAPLAPVVTDTRTAEPAASASARPRDTKTGRFIKADGTVASDAEHAAMEAASPPASVAPTTTAPAVAPPSSEPASFRGGNQRIQIPGSSVSPEGHWTIPADQVPRIRQLLGEGVAYNTTWRQRESEYKTQLEQAGAAGKAQAAKYNTAASMLWEVARQLLAEQPHELELLRRELDLTLRSADLNIPKVETKQATAPDPQQLETAARQTLSEYVEELLDTPQAKAVYNTPEKRQALQKRLQRRLPAYFTNQGDDIVLDTQIAKEDFEEELKDRLEAGRLSDAAEKAKQFNAARNVAPPAPPVVSTKGPSSTGAPSGRTFKTREEYNKAMGLA